MMILIMPRISSTKYIQLEAYDEFIPQAQMLQRQQLDWSYQSNCWNQKGFKLMFQV